MKRNNKIVLFGLPAAALIFGLALAGCNILANDDGDDGDDNNSGAGAVVSVTVSPATANVAKGGTQTFTAVVNGSNNPAQTVTWSIDESSKNAGTSINAEGVLTVAAAETLTSLTVRATSTQDNAKSGSATVAVTGGGSDITYTVTANGSATTATTELAFTFSGTVDGLTADDITVADGTGAAAKGTLSGSSLAITVSAGGTITVSIAKTGVESGGKTVTVFKGDEGAGLIGKWYDSPAKANTAYGVPYYEFTADGKILVEGSDEYQVRYSDLNLAAFTVSYSVNGTQGEGAVTYGVNGNRLNLSSDTPLDGSYFQNAAPIAISWTAADWTFTDYNSGGVRAAVTWGGTKGQEKFVATGDRGQIAYSSDGITWKAVVNSPFTGNYGNIRGVTWGGKPGQEKFVATGQSQTIAYSADGVTWTKASFPYVNTVFNNWIYDAAWGGKPGNETFVAVGDQNGVGYSSTGTSWDGTSIFGLKNGVIHGVAWGGPAGQEQFIAAGNKGMMWYSEDGEDWDLTGNSLAYYGEDLYGVTWGGGKFLVFGARGVLAYSDDGTPTNWHLAQKSGTSGFGYSLGNESYFCDIAFGGGKFIAVGNDEESDYRNRMLYSEDGINWIEIMDDDMFYDLAGGSGSATSQGIAYGKGRFVVVSGNKIAYSN